MVLSPHIKYKHNSYSRPSGKKYKIIVLTRIIETQKENFDDTGSQFGKNLSAHRVPANVSAMSWKNDKDNICCYMINFNRI